MEIPSLEAEGENSRSSALETIPDTLKTQGTSTEYIHDNPTSSDDQSQALRTRTKVDYKQLNDPQLHKPITRKQLDPDIPKIDEASKDKERANY